MTNARQCHQLQRINWTSVPMEEAQLARVLVPDTTAPASADTAAANSAIPAWNAAGAGGAGVGSGRHGPMPILAPGPSQPEQQATATQVEALLMAGQRNEALRYASADAPAEGHKPGAVVSMY